MICAARPNRARVRARSIARWRYTTYGRRCVATCLQRHVRPRGLRLMELAPHLPHDTKGTLEQSHMYWELVDRPNLMIKIPTTAADLRRNRVVSVRTTAKSLR